ncbi:MAG: hypothetical protein FJZ57_04875 [Chlamydiae bacterium]|nr:hypothetical protein [Chlamydiota bacterium]
MNMIKRIHIVNINNFFPELFELTYPTVEAYAKKFGYEINLITERKFPDWHINYEKMQVWEDGKGANLNILLDADVLIHPEFNDVMTFVPRNFIAFNDNYNASAKFKLNNYFIRDQRDVGIASNFVVSTDLTHDVWKPLKITPEEGKEITFVREGDIDEYCLSHNMAKYGLKYCGITWKPWMRKYVVHTGTGDREYALDLARKTVDKWSKLL